MKRFRPLTISVLRLVTLVALPSIACLSHSQSITASDVRNSTFIRFTTFDVPNSVNINPTAIGSADQIVGYYQDATYTFHAFVRNSDGAIASFDAPGAGQGSGLGTVVTGINPKGQIVGEDIYVNNNVLMSHGFVREADGTFTIFDALPDAIYTVRMRLIQQAKSRGLTPTRTIFRMALCGIPMAPSPRSMCLVSSKAWWT